jgi:hypothetical protein
MIDYERKLRIEEFGMQNLWVYSTSYLINSN